MMNTLASLFDWILTASFRASALTLIVLAAQFALRRRIGARACYALWLPMLVVLLTPVLPQSRWSIGSFFAAEQQEVSILPPAIDVPVQVQAAAPVALPAADPFVPVTTPLNWREIGLWTWLGVSAGLLLVSGVSHACALRRFRLTRTALSEKGSEQIAQMAREVGLRRAPRVWHSTAVASPAVTGLWRPVLLLPSQFERDFTTAEARLILQHELMHLKRHDLQLNALLCALLALHWFNPLLWLAFLKARVDCEAACDAQVLENAPRERRIEYGHALLKAETVFSPARLSLGFLGIFQRGAALRARIQYIAINRPTHPVMKLITSTCIVLLTFFGITRAEDSSVAIGPYSFRVGDSIRITQVQREGQAVTVKADYTLASADKARIYLCPDHTPNREGVLVPTGPEHSYQIISKGKGSITLHHPSLTNNPYHPLLNAAFYDAQSANAFGSIVFGAPAEVAEAVGRFRVGDLLGANIPLMRKLEQIILPEVTFNGVSLEQAIEFLRAKSREFDTTVTSNDPWEKGVNIMMDVDSPKPRINMNLRQVPLGEALRLVTEMVGSSYIIQQQYQAVFVTDHPKELAEELVARLVNPPPRPLAGIPASAKPLEAAKSIILPKLELNGATTEEAAELLSTSSREADPAKKGVKIQVKPGAAGSVTLSLQKIPVIEALSYVAELAGCKVTLEGDVFVIEPAVAVNFPNTSLRNILRFYGELTGKKTILDAALQGETIKIIAPKPLAKQYAITYIQASLLLHGYVIIPVDDNTVKVQLTRK